MYSLMSGAVVVATSHQPIEWSAQLQGWPVGSVVFSDPARAMTVRTDGDRRVSPVEFKLLFTAQERVAIRAARETDPVIDDFFDILDDPRLTGVDLTSSTTRGMVDYLVSKRLLTAERRDEIFNGRA